MTALHSLPAWDAVVAREELFHLIAAVASRYKRLTPGCTTDQAVDMACRIVACEMARRLGTVDLYAETRRESRERE